MATALNRLCVAALAVGALSAGCGASDPPTHAHPVTTPGQLQPVASEHVACSTAVDYRSLAQLRHDANAVAVLAPTGAQTVVTIAGVAFTTANVARLATVAGGRLPRTFRLRQLGAPGAARGDGCGPLVAPGSVYLAYLVPFKLRSHGRGLPGQYVVVGGTQGLFKHEGPSQVDDRSAPSFHAASIPSRRSRRASRSPRRAAARRAPQRAGSCCTAQAFPSGSLKNTNDPHGKS